MQTISNAAFNTNSNTGEKRTPKQPIANGAGHTAKSTSFIVIPARLASTRLPRKLLLNETGKPLLQHTYEAAGKARLAAGLCVAADGEELAAAVRGFGGRAFLTDPNCASGTDRIAEIVPQLGDVDILVNVQGDEPELSGETIDMVIRLLEENPSAQMATIATPIRRHEQLHDPACVKVVLVSISIDRSDSSAFRLSPSALRALYFSRAAIPHARTWSDELLTANPPHFFQHLGLYAYRRDFLLHLAKLPRTPLEQLESLEQLRVLENGYE
ncbi:MAG TPA: 3-deoxy-manno-octulosonate cytidylyltransferase, partial [Pirellulales bacterium]